MLTMFLVGLTALGGAETPATAVDLEALLGTRHYGLYMNGQKVGYATDEVTRDAGRITVKQDAQFRVVMAGVPQSMETVTARTYDEAGQLVAIQQTVVDPSGPSTFAGSVAGDELILRREVAGQPSEERLPRPEETLQDALKHAHWVRQEPAVGDTLGFSLFEPLMMTELRGTSEVVARETRVLDGVETPVYTIRTRLDALNIETRAVVTGAGTVLEDEVAGMLTMRLEPEEVAKDVSYSNDTIVSNAALLEAPIPDARTRDTLRLILRGPLTGDHLFNDNRQQLEAAGDHFRFSAQRVSLENFEPAHLPITEADVTPWLEPTPYVQSDAQPLIEQARAIVGDTTDTWEITQQLCEWVASNVRNSYSARLTNALEVLESREGDCTEHSILFIGLARALGLPAREVAGLIYVDEGKPGFYFHQWAKVWIGQWVDVDPTFNQPLVDATHIKLAEGDLFAQSRIIPLIGHVAIEQVPEDAAPTPAFENAQAEPDNEATPDNEGTPDNEAPADAEAETPGAPEAEAEDASADGEPGGA